MTSARRTDGFVDGPEFDPKRPAFVLRARARDSDAQVTTYDAVRNNLPLLKDVRPRSRSAPGHRHLYTP